MGKPQLSAPEIIEHVNPLSDSVIMAQDQTQKQPWEVISLIDSLIRLLKSLRMNLEPDK